MEGFSTKLRKLGVADVELVGPSRAELEQLRDRAGLNENLNRKRSTNRVKMTQGQA
jgi:hypothetical protein